MLAIEYNFPEEQWDAKFREFPDAYEKALIDEPLDESAPMEHIRSLIRNRPLPEWPAKEEYDNWPTDEAEGRTRNIDTKRPSGSDKSQQLPPIARYEPLGNDQIIVWVEQDGKPLVRGIYDELYASTARHVSYETS